MADANATVSTKKLYMVWTLSNGKHLTVSLAQPKDDITASQVAPVMQAFVTKNAFLVGTATATAAYDAYIRQTTTTDILNP